MRFPAQFSNLKAELHLLKQAPSTDVRGLGIRDILECIVTVFWEVEGDS